MELTASEIDKEISLCTKKLKFLQSGLQFETYYPDWVIYITKCQARWTDQLSSTFTEINGSSINDEEYNTWKDACVIGISDHPYSSLRLQAMVFIPSKEWILKDSTSQAVQVAAVLKSDYAYHNHFFESSFGFGVGCSGFSPHRMLVLFSGGQNKMTISKNPPEDQVAQEDTKAIKDAYTWFIFQDDRQES